jgi:glycosyltransferase involved in cell wall biosynthesis
MASWWTNRPLIWNLHDMLTADHFSPFNRWIATRWANRYADRVIVNSEATRDAFAESGGHVNKTGLVYNGIDATAFESLPTDAARTTRRALDLRPDTPVLGVFSRLAQWKGQHVILEALPYIPRAHVLLVGGALFGGDSAYKRRLKTTANRLGVQDRVHILGFRDDIPHLMKASDIIVHTSIAPEPFGRVIVEGMLASRPVIATAAGGALEIVDAGTTGLLVPPGDSLALAQAVTNLLNHPEQANAIAKMGHVAARNRFSVESMLSNVNQEVNKVL